MTLRGLENVIKNVCFYHMLVQCVRSLWDLITVMVSLVLTTLVAPVKSVRFYDLQDSGACRGEL